MAAIVRAARRLARHYVALLFAAAIALSIGGGLAAVHLRTQPAAVPFPVPVYQIEAKSGSCNASIANLNIGYVGTLQVPTPVDVDCDLLPDVLVSVNLIDLEGPLHDPLATDSTSYQDFLNDRAGRTLAPNIEVNRFPLDALAIILNKPSPPVRLNVKLTVKDLQLQQPDTILRFGYDTAEGGSIPTNFKAVVRGLDTFFNPLEAVVDTKNASTPPAQGADTVPVSYEGPLTLIGGVATSDNKLDAKLDIAYSPWPDVVKVAYASDDKGQHIDYSHGVGESIQPRYGTAFPNGTFERYVPGELPEVDMATKLDVFDNGDTLKLTADIDRLPRTIGLDIDTAADKARLDYKATVDGRLPDARINLRSVAGGELTRAQAHVEEIPPELHALWNLGNGNDISALFTTTNPDAPGFDVDTLGSGPGIGAIEVLYSNVDTTSFPAFVPTEQQFLNLQTLNGQQLVTARVERIRGVSFATRPDGFDIASRIGDGALPLQTNVQMDQLPDTGDRLDATATVAPLPEEIDVKVFTGDKTDATKPFKIVYDASKTVDVDAHAELREAGSTTAACGEPGTTCADLGIRHLPAHIDVSIGENGVVGPGATTDVAINTTPRPSSPKPDVSVDAILGKLDSNTGVAGAKPAGPVLLEASGVLRGIPKTVRLHFVEGADETLERLDVTTCELNATEKCPAGTDPIEKAEVQIRNFRDSKRAEANVPHPSSVAPQFATLTARGLTDPAKTSDPVVRFEAAARVRDITEVRYANVNGIFGVRSKVGDNRDLEVLLDVVNVIFGGNDPKTGPVDLKGRALVSPLPSEIDLCLRESDFPLTLTSGATFTSRCESTNPFGDGSVKRTPLTFSYLASSIFNVEAGVDFTSYGKTTGAADDHTIHGAAKLTNVPKDLTAHLQSPPEKPVGSPPSTDPERLRVRTIAPGATNTNVDLEFEDRLGGATCADPQPAGDITCAAASVKKLPDYASVLADTGPGDDTHARVFACDLKIATSTCQPGTEGMIDEVKARLRMVKGNPVEEGDLKPFIFAEHPFKKANTAANSYTLALRLDQDDTDNKELRAEGRLAQFRSLSFDRTVEGFDIRTDLGDGKSPLLGSIGIDTRVPASAPPPAPGDDPVTGKLVLADTRVDPLPQVITISQHGPGDDQKANPLLFGYHSTGPVNVDARAQIFDQVAGPLCGDHGTVCATLHLDRLPSDITAKVGTFDEGMPETPANANDVRRRMFVDLDAIPFGNVAPPDLVMDAMLGPKPDGDPPFDDTPMIAHGELHGFSQKARIRLTQSGTLLADESLQDSKFEEAVFATCQLVENSKPLTCGSNPEFPIQEIAVSARNFHSRPIDFPVPRRDDVPHRNTVVPANSDAMYAEIVGRGDDFEAHAGFTSVREFRMVNLNDILGVKVGGGDGQKFTAHADLGGLSLPERDLGKDDVDDGVEQRTLDIDANASLSNVPTQFAFCMRQNGAKLHTPTTDFVAPCEDDHPFQHGNEEDFFNAVDPETAPMSLAYRANAPITQVKTDARAQIHRVQVIPVDFGFPIGIIHLPFGQPTMHVFGDVTIDHLPENLTAHIETPVDKEDRKTPKDKGGPIRALFYYDDPPPLQGTLQPVDITFKAEYTQGDAVCKDLRDQQVAFCLGGKLENLPSRVKAFIDPEAPLFDPGSDPPELAQNLRVETNNADPTKKMNLRNIKISVVKDDKLKPATDPSRFDKPAFDITASPKLDTVDMFVQNFVAPNPLPPVAGTRNGAVPDQTVSFRQRGDFFRADVLVKDVRGGGFKTGRNKYGQATDTQMIRVDFGIPGAGPKPTIRGYVDLLTVNEAGDPTHVFADAILKQVPFGLDICFRGKFPAPDKIDHDLHAAPGTEIFCDNPPEKLGGFQFKGRVASNVPESELDVDAIFRMTKDSDTNVLKAAAKVLNIPNVVQGTFGDGAVAVESFLANGTTPTGIDDVKLQMADFDFDDDGYAGPPPWGVDVPGSVILPDKQPGPDHEHARVAYNGSDFQVEAHLGTAFDGSDGARITKFFLEPDHCKAPAGSDAYFPHYPAPDTDPTTKDNEYTCVRAELEQQSNHPLLLDADLVLDGTPIQIHDGGLTKVPAWFQATIAKTETMTGADKTFRRRCGPESTETATADCMPPLLHFDSSGDSQLFGRLLLGSEGDLDTLKKRDPYRSMSDLEALPVPLSVRPSVDPDPWAAFAGAKGARLKLGEFKGAAGQEDRKAVRASFRLDIPRALTVDQVQKWDFKSQSVTLNAEASDLRFHYVMRKADGDVVAQVGELAAMIHNFDTTGQTLVSHVDDNLKGIPVPGEFGIDFFERNNKSDGRHLIQADLRTSVKLAARLRMIAGTDADLGDVDARLRNLNGVDPSDASYTTNPDKPSFRARIELKGPKDPYPPPPAEAATEDWKKALLCVVWCLAVDIGDPAITADVDLEPNAGAPVRLLEGVVNTVDKLGLELKTYRDINAGTPAQFSADSPASPALPVALTGQKAGLHVDLDPFNIFIHAGVPILASFDALVLGEMNVDLDIAKTNHFMLKQNATAMETQSEGSNLSALDVGFNTWLQVALAPGFMSAYLSIFWPFPPIYLFYGMAAGPAIPFFFDVCPTPGHANPITPYTDPVLKTPLKTTAFLPFSGPTPIPPLVTFGNLKPILDPILGLAGPPIVCAIFGLDGIDLFSGGAPAVNADRSPGDPLIRAGHQVAGLGHTAPPPATITPPTTAPAPLNLTVNSGETVSICGDQLFDKITIKAGGVLNVATAAGNLTSTPYIDCPADTADKISVGSLNLFAAGKLEIGGIVNGPDGGQLMLTGDDLQMDGTVNVNSGFVQLNAADDLNMTGTIDANYASTSMPTYVDNTGTHSWASNSGGNSGASHGGAGGHGKGFTGNPGPVYGSGVTANQDPGTERGARGAAGETTGGAGGGTVALRGSDVTVSGTINANGFRGGDDTATGHCQVDDDASTTEVNEFSANNGIRAGGGGSGGGVAVHGVTVHLTGQINAVGGRGGDGKYGGGGGGGGGVVRVNGGDVDPADGSHINVAEGGRGFGTCPDSDAGEAGEDGVKGNPGVKEVTEVPRSHAIPTGKFWYTPADVKIPFHAAASEDIGSAGKKFDVYLCGIKVGPENLQLGGDFGLEMPKGTQPDSDHHCGQRDDATQTGRADKPDAPLPQELKKLDLDSVEVSPDGSVLIPSSAMPAGIWGLWTVAAKPDFWQSIFGCNAFWPFSSGLNPCQFEKNPAIPGATIGVDPDPPQFKVAPLNTTVNIGGDAVSQTSTVQLELSDMLDELPRGDNPAATVLLSGIDRFACYVDDGTTFGEVTCSRSADSLGLTLTGGEKRYKIYVVAFDQANNPSVPLDGSGLPQVAKFDDASTDPFDDDRITLVYDKTPPAGGQAHITVPPAETGNNGWYVAPPTQYVLDTYSDGTNGSGQHPEGGFQYRFDGADWTSCTAPCTLATPVPLPGAGTHKLTWKARDAAALESGEQSIPIRVDGTPPKTAIDVVPAFEGAWITAAHPTVVVRGIDEFGGSGIGTSALASLCTTNPLKKSGTCISTTGIGGTYKPYTGPVELDSGEDQVVCVFSIDTAGNKEVVTLADNCTDPLDIDNDLPTGNITVTPATPTGDAPWYDGDHPVPTVKFSGYNGTGSPEPVGGGFRYRVDNSTELTCANNCVVNPSLLGAGSHVLHWTVVDTAGNRRPEQAVPLFIDTSDPRSHTLVEPVAPAGSNGWYLTKPYVTLVGFDEPVGSLALRPVGSGIRRIRYKLDSAAPVTYFGPFAINPGDHTLCVLATDIASNDEADGVFAGEHCQRIAVDVDDPKTGILQNTLETPVIDGQNGWFKNLTVKITQKSTDTVPGSLLVPQDLGSTLCDHVVNPDPAPAGVCISVDGKAPAASINGPEFGPYTGAITLGEGRHVIRAFSIDNAGRRSAMDRKVVLIDRSDPVSIARLRAPYASRTGLRDWWRHQPTLVLRAIDGDQNAGIDHIEYRFDGAGTIATYKDPVTMPVGIHYVEHRAVDRSGRTGAWRKLDVAVDLSPPVVTAGAPDPALWLYVKVLNLITFGPEKAKLNWTIKDDLAKKVHVDVLVFDAAGIFVRRLDGGDIAVTPGVAKSGSTLWDGKDNSLIGVVPAGVYYYRVVAIDDAGNPAQSGESKKLQIKLKLAI
jgi:hypothetical protein